MSNKQEFINIYDEFRDLELNKEYYAHKTEKVKRHLRYMDIFLALFASSSGVLGFALWSQSFYNIQVGPTLLSLATGAAVVIGIIRPYLKLEDNHERLSSIQGSYNAISFVMNDVVRAVKTEESVSDKEKAIFDVLRQVRASLQSKEDVRSDRELIAKLQLEINQRYPESTFYYPPDKAE